MAVRGVRGATTVTRNDRDEILEATKELLTRMVEVNNLDLGLLRDHFQSQLEVVKSAYALYVDQLQRNDQSDYRDFILSYNGGYFSDPIFVSLDAGCPRDRLTVLYGIGASDKTAELASKRHLALFSENDPIQVLPIGYTIMGNLLILIVDDDSAGSIVLKRASSDDYFNIADGINGLFDLIVSSEGASD